MNRIYIGNLPFSANEQEVRDAFSQFGAIEEVALIMDHHSGRPKGFGFVTYVSSESADEAIAKMNGQEFGDPKRTLRVNLAKPKEKEGGGGRGFQGRRSFNQSDEFNRSEYE